jgi:hypothetical protein
MAKKAPSPGEKYRTDSESAYKVMDKFEDALDKLKGEKVDEALADKLQETWKKIVSDHYGHHHGLQMDHDSLAQALSEYKKFGKKAKKAMIEEYQSTLSNGVYRRIHEDLSSMSLGKAKDVLAGLANDLGLEKHVNRIHTKTTHQGLLTHHLREIYGHLDAKVKDGMDTGGELIDFAKEKAKRKKTNSLPLEARAA